MRHLMPQSRLGRPNIRKSSKKSITDPLVLRSNKILTNTKIVEAGAVKIGRHELTHFSNRKILCCRPGTEWMIE